MRHLVNRKIISWCLYDWANSAFATTVIAGFFPVFFKQFWAQQQSVTDSTFYLGLVNSIASLLIVAMAPLLGAVADHLSQKKRFLLGFAVLGILMSAGLSLVAQGEWLLALLLYLFGLLGFSGSNIFYDALILDVTSLKHVDFVSGMGFSFGYLGGGLLFLVNVLMVSQPHWFGLADASEAVQLSFVLVAVWWALFSLPLLLFVREHRQDDPPAGRVIIASYRSLLQTLKRIMRLRMTFLFLLAYWFYIDGVDTIIRMAVDFGLSVGLESNGLLIALLVTQFVGFPAALLFGHIGQLKGPKFGISICLVVYGVIVFWAYQLQQQWEFYVLAVAVGLVQGGVQSLSRSLFARLVPPQQKAAFFGFYNMLGKFAAVIGPVMVGTVALLTQDSRTSILSVLVLFGIGALLLARVNVEKGMEEAALFHLDK
ncbi:MAG: MFS transporter [Chromatiales bacterium]|jgi:UMF1 family MFS transporter